MGTVSSPGPLDGLLVADLSRVLAGPYATQLLGDLGATVIKVEAPVGDDTRAWAPPEHDGVSTYYLGVNRNKSAVVLDFRDPDDRQAALELVRRADIVVENFKPGGLQKFGLDYDSVAADNPGVVYASISGFGSADGAGLPGYDILVQAVSGLMSLTGDSDGPAYRSGVSVFDIMTGMQALIGILSALRHRDRTGEGQHVEVNLLMTALSAMANHSSSYLTTGQVPFRLGNAHPSLFPYEPLPVKDGELVVIAANDTQFATLAAAIGRPELSDDPRFATAPNRNRNRELLRPELIAALAKHTREEWFELLTQAGLACGPINTIDGGFALASRLGLNPVVQVGVEVGSPETSIPMVRNPITFSRTPANYRSAPPTLGQDSAAIRAWLAGKTEEMEESA